MIERPDSLDDTIVACATAPGEAAIAVLRLSGPRARDIGAQVAPGAGRRTHRLVLADIVGRAGSRIDRGMVVEMHAPHSYTGEDVVEFHLHGAQTVVRMVTQRCLQLGARLARAGEFTLRAFLYGRMNLAEAEAVGDLVASRTELQAEVAAAHLGGGLADRVGHLEKRLEAVLVAWQAALDFPEHPTGHGWAPEHRNEIDDVSCRVQELVENARIDANRSRSIVLCGAPNVGKSTLLNAWVGVERVLVDSAPGTTRDPVEVEVSDGMTRWSVWDTAGIRDAGGLEDRGIDMARRHIAAATHAVWLVDPDHPVWPDEDLNVMLIGGKADVASASRRLEIEAIAESGDHVLESWVSGKTGEGVSELRRRLIHVRSRSDDRRSGELVVTRERHVRALRRCLEALERTGRAQDAGSTLDVMTMELEEAARALGSIIGRDADMEVLESIFSEFCIGK